jgi:hypothetical protein
MATAALAALGQQLLVTLVAMFPQLAIGLLLVVAAVQVQSRLLLLPPLGELAETKATALVADLLPLFPEGLVEQLLGYHLRLVFLAL